MHDFSFCWLYSVKFLYLQYTMRDFSFPYCVDERGLQALKNGRCSFYQTQTPQPFMETFPLMVIETRRTLKEDYGFKMRETGDRNSIINFLPIKVLFVLKLKLYSIHIHSLDIQ